MCFSSGKKAETAATPAAPPPAPAIPASQSAAAANATQALAAEPVQQIGFARKKENRKRWGSSTGPRGRRNETTPSASVSGDTGSGIRM